MIEAFKNEWEDRKHRKDAQNFPGALAMAASNPIPCIICNTSAHAIASCPFLAGAQEFSTRSNERAKSGNSNSNNNNNNNNRSKGKHNAQVASTASPPVQEFAGNASL